MILINDTEIIHLEAMSAVLRVKKKAKRRKKKTSKENRDGGRRKRSYTGILIS